MRKKESAVTVTAAILITLFFILLLIPVVYLSPVNRATGDDYNYGILTRDAWIHTHSLIEVCKAACRTIGRTYDSHQGTWFSIFLFSIQPEVFHDRAYCIVAPMMLFFWIGSTFYLFRQILCKKTAFDSWHFILITICFLIISLEFIPSTKSAIYWFNGCAHYMLPFSMCQMATAWLFRYCETYRKKYLCGITVFLILLGGSNYQAALFALIVTGYVLLYVLFLKKERRILWLILPLSAEIPGLIVSMMAPGNQIRTIQAAYEKDSTLDFSLIKIAETIGKSFLYALKDIGVYQKERPLIFIGLFILFLLFMLSFCSQKTSFSFPHPFWTAAMLFGLYSAMQAPEIYAGVPVSGGVPNTNFQVFLLSASGILLMIAEKAAKKLQTIWKEDVTKKVCRILLLPGLLLCLPLIFLLKSNIKDSTSYIALRYITSGEAADFRMQMDLQTRLMEDADTENVIVPFINDVQGPLMHMPITEDEKKFTNWAAAGFYGKNSVAAVDRAAWEAEYGEFYNTSQYPFLLEPIRLIYPFFRK